MNLVKLKIRKIFNMKVEIEIYQLIYFGNGISIDDTNQHLYIGKYYKIIHYLCKFKFKNSNEVVIIRQLIKNHIKDSRYLNILLLKVLFYYIKLMKHNLENDPIIFIKLFNDLVVIVNNILKNKYFDPSMCQINIINIFTYFYNKPYLRDLHKMYSILIDIIKHKDFNLLIHNNKLSRYVMNNFQPYINIKDLMKSIKID